MKILMLSWEYPPRNIGGLSNHVYNIAHALNREGHEVFVITCCEEGSAPLEEIDDGVFVRRVMPYNIGTEDFAKWIMHLNFAMLEEAIRLINSIGLVNIIHAHDWLTAYAAKALKWAYNIPLVCTIHATEHGRNNGIRTELQKYISDAERMLVGEAWKVIVCSSYMKQHVAEVLNCSLDKIFIMPNGVELKEVTKDHELCDFRKRFDHESEKIIFFIGRHVFEKGIHVLIDSIPRVLKIHRNVKLIIAGVGPMTEELKQKAINVGVSSNINFVGYLADEDKEKIYKIADAAVVPSLYEPFGIVALEAMAAGCPVVASDCGGLSELIDHKVNGLKAIPGSSESLSNNIIGLLNDTDLGEKLRKAALDTVKGLYTWEKIAGLHDKLYGEVKAEAKGTRWEVKTKRTRKKKITEVDQSAEEQKIKEAIALETEKASKDDNAVKIRRKKESSTEKNTN